MSTQEYRKWLAQRKAKPETPKPRKPAKPKPEPFLDWVLKQVHRDDDIGRLARDIESEQRRIGRPLTSLNRRLELLWHCDHAPKSVGLNRAIANAALDEWTASMEKKSEDPILDYQI